MFKRRKMLNILKCPLNVCCQNIKNNVYIFYISVYESVSKFLISKMNSKLTFLCICRLLQTYRKSPVHHWNQENIQRKLLYLYTLYKRMVKREKKMKQEKRIWVRPIFMPERRFLQGASNNLIPEMIHSNDPKYFNYL